MSDGTAAATASARYAHLELSGEYRLENKDHKIRTVISLPGDVHTALLNAGKIPDPYFGNNEQDVMWVNKTPWSVERTFGADAEMAAGHLTLTLSQIDCIATILLNGHAIGAVDNQFIRHDFDVTGKVRVGENVLRIEFEVVRDVARKRYEQHPFL